MGDACKVIKVTNLLTKLFEDNACLNNAVKIKETVMLCVTVSWSV